MRVCGATVWDSSTRSPKECGLPADYIVKRKNVWSKELREGFVCRRHAGEEERAGNIVVQVRGKEEGS